MAKKNSESIRIDPVSSVETFRDPRGWTLTSLVASEPAAFNGIVQVEKWRIIAEKIDEPREIIFARLETLWRQSDNYHHYDPLARKAEELGYTFTGEFGQDRK